MCKYCEEHLIEKYNEYGIENLSERTESKNNSGVYTGIQTFIDTDENAFSIVVCLDNKYIKPIIDYKYIPINFCPICGRNLGECTNKNYFLPKQNIN